MQEKIVGVLAVQGSVVEHERVLRQLGHAPRLVRTVDDLRGVTHLVLPGGESTTMMKLLQRFGLWEVLQARFAADDIALLGTCAGAILLSYLGLGLTVDRNGYGAQQASFSAGLQSEQFPDQRGVFIRAPIFTEVGDSLRVLATYENVPVLVQGGRHVALAFHPEISGDTRVHEYWLNL